MKKILGIVWVEICKLTILDIDTYEICLLFSLLFFDFINKKNLSQSSSKWSLISKGNNEKLKKRVNEEDSNIIYEGKKTEYFFYWKDVN